MAKNIKNRYRQSLGKWGEDTALKFLTDQGLHLVERNYRSPDGEIDLILTDEDQLVMVEVKTRKDAEFGLPEDAVTDEKIEHLALAAEWFLQKHPNHEDNWRIDVVSIMGTPNPGAPNVGAPNTGAPNTGEPQIEWFQNVS